MWYLVGFRIFLLFYYFLTAICILCSFRSVKYLLVITIWTPLCIPTSRLLLIISIVLIRPIEGLVFLEYILHNLILLWGVYATLSQESIMRIVNHILHIQNIAYCFQNILGLLMIFIWIPPTVVTVLSRILICFWIINKRSITESEGLCYRCKYHFNRNNEVLSYLRGISVKHIHF